MERYKRQISIPQIGTEGQMLLQSSTAAVIGAGGLGAPVLTYLAAAGVGNILVIDKDAVEESNLNRQFLYSREDIGRKKAEAAKEKLEKQNPQIKVTAFSDAFTEENGRELLKGTDVVVDCVDSVKTRISVNKICLLLRIPLVEGGIYGFYGYVTSVFQNSPCLECMGYTKEMEQKEIPSLGAAAGVVGSLQAVEALKILLGKGEPFYGRLLQYDGLDGSFDEIKVEKKKDCSLHKAAEMEFLKYD